MHPIIWAAMGAAVVLAVVDRIGRNESNERKGKGDGKNEADSVDDAHRDGGNRRDESRAVPEQQYRDRGLDDDVQPAVEPDSGGGGAGDDRSRQSDPGSTPDGGGGVDSVRTERENDRDDGAGNGGDHVPVEPGGASESDRP